jgi:hypothetical protein
MIEFFAVLSTGIFVGWLARSIRANDQLAFDQGTINSLLDELHKRRAIELALKDE